MVESLHLAPNLVSGPAVHSDRKESVQAAATGLARAETVNIGLGLRFMSTLRQWSNTRKMKVETARFVEAVV